MNRRASLRLALLVTLSSTFVAACAGGGNTSGGAGTSGGSGPGNGGTTGSGGSGAGTAGTTGTAGSGSGGAGTGGGSVGTAGAAGGTTGAAGNAGTAGVTGSAGSAGGGTAGTTGSGGAGTTGTGGAAGRGGTTGAGGSAAGTTGTGGAGGSLPPNAIIIQDNFDITASGGPADAKWAAYPQGQTNLAPVIDTTRHETGAHAAMATSSSSGLGSFLVPAAGTLAGTPVTGNAFYVRVWINWQKATATISGHSGFLVGSAARDESDTELRLGISSKGPNGTPRMDLNLQNPKDGAGGEVTRYSNGFTDGGNPASFTGTGYQFAANTWTCVEAFFNGATSGSEFRLWIGDQEVTEMHVTDFSATGSGGRTHWAPTYNYIKIGAQDYDANLGQIWYDDVVVATQKIGCSYVVP